MDFKYIEQLLQRYFDGVTTSEEEHILHAFFRQSQMPSHLRQWQPLFRAEDQLSHAHLDEHFDERLLERVGERHVKAQRIPLRQRLQPLFTAAAFVAFAVVIGTAVEHSTTAEPSTALPTTADVQDELDPTATTPLDIKSAEVAPAPPQATLNDGLTPPTAISDSLQDIN